jgi:hypothetical protein
MDSVATRAQSLAISSSVSSPSLHFPTSTLYLPLSDSPQSPNPECARAYQDELYTRFQGFSSPLHTFRSAAHGEHETYCGSGASIAQAIVIHNRKIRTVRTDSANLRGVFCIAGNQRRDVRVKLSYGNKTKWRIHTESATTRNSQKTRRSVSTRPDCSNRPQRIPLECTRYLPTTRKA